MATETETPVLSGKRYRLESAIIFRITAGSQFQKFTEIPRTLSTCPMIFLEHFMYWLVHNKIAESRDSSECIHLKSVNIIS